MTLGTHIVKVLTNDAKRYRFLAPDGYLTTKRMHAGLDSKERCEEFASNILRDNPDTVVAVKVVQFWKEG